MSKKIWFIDENENQSKTYARQLRRLMPDTVQVETVYPPFVNMNDYASILSDPETVCVIIDQKLKDSGIATYDGIELAQFLRGIDSKIPIYILTNFADLKDEYASGELNVEEVLSKDIFNDDVEKQILQARLLRRIDVHEDILLSRAERFRSLLKKQFENTLTEEEQAELKNLQFERVAPVEAASVIESQNLQNIIDSNNELLEALRKLPK
ncbi:MAG: response regulator [Chloroflexota bacterium]